MLAASPKLEQEQISIRIPVARSKAATRAVMWIVPALILGVAAVTVYRGLIFTPSTESHRLVDFSIGVAALPLALGAIVSLFNGLRWLLLCGWPGRVAIYADENELRITLGPFGSRRYDAGRLDVRYLFELSADADDAPFEAFLPEEQQRATLLPRIEHPDAASPISQTILKYAVGTEAQIAAALRPVIERWRGQTASPDREPSAEEARP